MSAYTDTIIVNDIFEKKYAIRPHVMKIHISLLMLMKTGVTLRFVG